MKKNIPLLFIVFLFGITTYSQSPGMTGFVVTPGTDSVVIQFQYPATGNLFPMVVTGTIDSFDHPVFTDSIVPTVLHSTTDTFFVVSGLLEKPGKLTT